VLQLFQLDTLVQVLQGLSGFQIKCYLA
jgi:hypothetical protein